MENYILDHDINTMYITASSFPAGIMDAHNRLHTPLVQPKPEVLRPLPARRWQCHCIKAAAEEIHTGEANQLGLETFVIKQGAYSSIYITDFMKDLPAISNAFKQLLTNPKIDHNGCCVEWYVNDKDVRCMVRLEG